MCYSFGVDFLKSFSQDDFYGSSKFYPKLPHSARGVETFLLKVMKQVGCRVNAESSLFPDIDVENALTQCSDHRFARRGSSCLIHWNFNGERSSSAKSIGLNVTPSLITFIISGNFVAMSLLSGSDPVRKRTLETVSLCTEPV